MEKLRDKIISEWIIKRVESTKEKLQSFEDEGEFFAEIH